MLTLANLAGSIRHILISPQGFKNSLQVMLCVLGSLQRHCDTTTTTLITNVPNFLQNQGSQAQPQFKT